MNKKVKTITSWLAAAIFLLALAINIKVTLDDPFVMLSDEALAHTIFTNTSIEPGKIGDQEPCRLDLGGGWFTGSVEYICVDNYVCPSCTCTPIPCGG
ncbi:hypothetical protein SAMN05444280_1572 [Tangfeifania diversioriginum]|uniref:NVEALA protein n=1 Tax=Tangfeifania diversioriginum TaxID=1168035 RepID=A0A1M6PCP3_9BACT|nr:hypothetical protein [Tangfeifania diversioriginum]SHK05632.1 hypothetical protein SAMN05444280_1572 [Tangfeifania diversioriginum]